MPDRGDRSPANTVLAWDPERGWIPAIPEPFWTSRWFRRVPACLVCALTFRNRNEYEWHWTHIHAPLVPPNKED